MPPRRDDEFRASVRGAATRSDAGDRPAGVIGLHRSAQTVSDAELVNGATELPDMRQHAGRFEFLTIVGEGGLGVVWLARDRQLHRFVAIKQLRGAAMTDRGRLRLQREAVMLGSLPHPNIVTVFDLIEDAAGLQLVMEFVSGAPSERESTYLKEWPDPAVTLEVRALRERFSVRQTIGLGLALAAALSHAHKRSIYHRDVKPANILLDADDRAKLVDFGIGKLQNADEPASAASSPATARNVTHDGTTLGTHDYGSPEQLAGASRGDACDDVHGLGKTLLFACTGDTKLPADERLASLGPILAKAIAPRTDRYSTVDLFCAALQQAADILDRPAAPAPILAWPRRRWPLATTVLCVIAAGTVIAAIIGTQPDPTRGPALDRIKELEDEKLKREEEQRIAAEAAAAQAVARREQEFVDDMANYFKSVSTTTAELNEIDVALTGYPVFMSSGSRDNAKSALERIRSGWKRLAGYKEDDLRYLTPCVDFIRQHRDRALVLITNPKGETLGLPQKYKDAARELIKYAQDNPTAVPESLWGTSLAHENKIFSEVIDSVCGFLSIHSPVDKGSLCP